MSVRSLDPFRLMALNHVEREGALRSLMRSGLAPADWAAQYDLSNPIDTTLLGSGSIVIDDGHHRHLAAQIRGVRLSANVKPWRGITPERASELLGARPSADLMTDTRRSWDVPDHELQALQAGLGLLRKRATKRRR